MHFYVKLCLVSQILLKISLAQTQETDLNSTISIKHEQFNNQTNTPIPKKLNETKINEHSTIIKPTANEKINNSINTTKPENKTVAKQNQAEINIKETPIINRTETVIENKTEIINKTEVPIVNEKEVPRVNKTELPMVNKTEVPIVNKTEVPIVNEKEVPTVNKTEVPIVNKTEVPIVNKTEVPKMNKAIENQTENQIIKLEKEKSDEEFIKKTTPIIAQEAIDMKQDTHNRINKFAARNDNKNTKENEPKQQESTTKLSKDTSILVVLFVAVLIIGATAFTYNFLKKRKQQKRDIENINKSQSSILRRSLQSLTTTTKIEQEQEMKPLIKNNLNMEQEMIEIKHDNAKENGNVNEDGKNVKK